MHCIQTANKIVRSLGREALKPIVVFDHNEVESLFDAAPFALPPIVRTEWTLRSVLQVTAVSLDEVRETIRDLVDDATQTFGFAVVGSDGPASFQIGVFVKPAVKSAKVTLTDEEFFEGADPRTPAFIY